MGILRRDYLPPHNNVPYIKSKMTTILCPKNGRKVSGKSLDTLRHLPSVGYLLIPSTLSQSRCIRSFYILFVTRSFTFISS